MEPIVECVPNFSEGRNQETITAIADAIKATKGCRLLDVDPGVSTNRTVYTFVGPPDAVFNGALNAALIASEKIDMQTHAGEHHRIGALDVCPFIPVSNITMDECVELSKRFGQKLSEKLNVPVYLYEKSQPVKYRKTLPQIRDGQYEGIKDRIVKKKWKPDFGPSEFVPQWGATITGARNFLIAYNVNLLSTPNQAHRIALNLREAGRGPKEPGKFKEVKGMGWFVKEENLSQVTVNITDYKTTPIHVLFEAVKKEAKKLNIAVIGSEIVGLVPLDALLMAATYHIEKENLFILDEDQKIRLVTERLGLHSITPFKPEEKIIEYIVAPKKKEPLAGLSVRDFIQEIAARTSAPGGGSASAAIAAMGAGLGSMVAKLTQGVRKFENVDARMRELIPPLHHASHSLIAMIDADTDAFKEYVKALKLPDATAREQKIKKDRMELGLKKAAEVPLSVMRIADSAWEAMEGVAQYGNIASISDIQVGAKALETGIWGAFKNIEINMVDIQDAKFKKKILKEADTIKKQAMKNCQTVLDILENRKD